MSFIVIEGLDGSGKGTQIELLQKALSQLGKDCTRITFPNYASPSSALVKLYLGGSFGENPADVNPYAACTFYAVDRFASFQTGWKQDLMSGKTVLADRYTTSNIVYQMSKLPKREWDSFLAWVEDFEYEKLRLPRPDQVIYLDMPPEVSQKLLTGRYGGDEQKKDIHESHVEFLLACRESAYFAARRLGWKMICCAENEEPRTIDSIHKEVLQAAILMK